MFSMRSIKSDEKEPPVFRQTRFQMNTFFSIEVEAGGIQARQAVDAVFAETKRIERMLSRFLPDSEICRVNREAWNEPQKVSQEVFELLETCMKLSEMTDGAFDITVAPLMELWTEAEQRRLLPQLEAIHALSTNCGSRKITLDRERQTVFFESPFLKIDLGAAGKGYALDKAVSFLRYKGVNHAKLDFGGHLYHLGEPEDDNLIGIRNLFQPDDVVYTLPLNNRSISTSANYERGLTVRGRTYSHIINPATGFPVDNGLLNVSIVSASALKADMLSTAVFVAGLRDGMRLVKETPDVEAIVITKNDGKPILHHIFPETNEEEVMELPKCA